MKNTMQIRWRDCNALGLAATEQYELAREKVRGFIHAKSEKEIIFTRNTTESINLAAYSYGLSHLKPGDEILVTIMEHHSNLLPWQMVARQTGAKLVYLDCEQDGSFSDEAISNAISEKTKFAAIGLVSNVLGRRNPVEKIIKLVHEKGGVVLVDAAQAVLHETVDVTALDADFLAFRPQNDGADGNRCALRKRGTVRGKAAISDRRGDDRIGDKRGCSLRRTAT